MEYYIARYDLNISSAVFKYLLFVLCVSHASCYPLVPSKIYSQSLPASSGPWSKIIPYPFGAYQPSIPVQYYGRYFTNPYFVNGLQNSDYYIGHDSYSPNFDDNEYYSNILYYIPANRRVPFYHQNLMNTPEQMEDADYDEADEVEDPAIKSHRDWWLEKNTNADEELDFNQVNRMEDLFAKSPSKSIFSFKPSKNTNKPQPAAPNRYAETDGFGRKKERKEVYGSYRPAPRKEQRKWVYGIPVNYDYDDQDVKDLKSLRKDMDEADKKISQSIYASWAAGNVKRSAATSQAQTSEAKRNFAFGEKISRGWEPNKSSGPTLKFYDEGGREYLRNTDYNKNSWIEYEPQDSSVFDTIKKLLALEDRVDEANQEIQLRKMLKRKQSNSSAKKLDLTSSEYITTETAKNALKVDESHSKVDSSTRSSIRNKKRSIPEKHGKLYTDEDSLGKELNALRQLKS